MTHRIIWLVPALALGLPLTAQSQDLVAAEQQLFVLALDQERPDNLLVREVDPQRGTSIAIVQVATGKLTKTWPVETKADEKKRVKRMTRKKFPIKAVIDQVEPKGRYTIVGAPDRMKKFYEILALRDGRVGVLARIPLQKSEKGEYAVGMLKEVIWAPAGKMLMVVVNQKMELRDGPYDVDRIQAITFRPWKVKWIKPPESEGDSETPAP